MKLALTLLFVFLSMACSSKQKRPELKQSTNFDCGKAYEAAPLNDVVQVLNTVSSLFDRQCYQETIALGNFVQNHSRDKFYHFFNETFEFVTPEGTFTEYVLESYERSYLSFLMALSYEGLARSDSAQVELRKAYEEGRALLYNYGDDPVNLVLQAALWENSKTPWNSRPLWKKAAELSPDNLILKKFAEDRIRQIDTGKKPSKAWKIYALGKFPGVDWTPDLKNSQGSYFTIKPKQSFIASCSSNESLLIPTEAWAQKIARKYDRSYHPLMNMKTWTRLPVGLTVGAMTAITGAGVAVAGCGLDFYATKGSGSHALCEASVDVGGNIMGESGTLTGYVLRPDLRFWNEVPAAFLITHEPDLKQDFCQINWAETRKLLTTPTK